MNLFLVCVGLEHSYTVFAETNAPVSFRGRHAAVVYDKTVIWVADVHTVFYKFWNSLNLLAL